MDISKMLENVGSYIWPDPAKSSIEATSYPLLITKDVDSGNHRPTKPTTEEAVQTDASLDIIIASNEWENVKTERDALNIRLAPLWNAAFERPKLGTAD